MEECLELKDACICGLRMDRLAFHPKSGILGKTRLVVGMVCRFLLFYVVFISIISLTVLRAVGLPADWSAVKLNRHFHVTH